MKMKDNIIDRLNIENLTSLWQVAGEAHQSFFSCPKFSYSLVNGAEWPNRLWFANSIDQVEFGEVKAQVLMEHPQLIVPYWAVGDDGVDMLFAQHGFQRLFDQVAMYLRLAEANHEGSSLAVRRISSAEDMKQWAGAFAQSFGYHISPDTLLKTHERVFYYLVCHEHKPVGTAIAFPTESVLGIHAVGIIPEARRKGLARQLMQWLINNALEEGYDFVTLQASESGRGLYQQLGFREQFLIRNYRSA